MFENAQTVDKKGGNDSASVVDRLGAYGAVQGGTREVAKRERSRGFFRLPPSASLRVLVSGAVLG